MIFPILAPLIPLISSAAATISASVATIGTAVSGFAASVGGLLATAMEALAPIAQQVMRFANDFLQILGVLKPGESIEEFGERALQAMEAGTKLDDFDDFMDYVQHLRAFDLDEEKAGSRGLVEKIIAGLGVSTVGVEQKFDAEAGSLNGLWLLPLVNKEFFTPERVAELVNSGRLAGDIMDYLNGKLDVGEANAFEERLERDNAGSELSSEAKGELYSALDSAKEGWDSMRDNIQQYLASKGE